MFNIFSKKNPYIQSVENILSEKNVNDSIKKMIISVFQKIDENYLMYQEVNVEVEDEKVYKEELLEILKGINTFFIVEKEDNIFEIKKVKKSKKDEENLVQDTSDTLKFENNELSIFKSLISKKKRYFNIKSDYSYSHILSRILIEASIMDEMRMFLNYTKYSWEKKDIKEISNYKEVFYHNLLWQLGYDFINEWKKDSSFSRDYLEEFNNTLIQKFGEEKYKEINMSLEKVLYALATKEEKKALEYIIKNDKKTLDLMEDTKNFLGFIGEEKVKLIDKISKLEKVLNDSELLSAAFSVRKEKMLEENEEKYAEFSINEYKENLEVEYFNSKEKVSEYTNIQNPEKYLKTKEDLKNRIDFFENPNIDEVIVEFQEKIFDTMYDVLNNEESEKVIVDSIYHMRYLRYLKYNEQKEAYLNPNLYQKMDKILKRLVYNGINNKVFNKVSQDFYTNYPIISPGLKMDIPELTEIEIAIIPRNNLVLQVYIHDLLYKEIELIEINKELVNLKPQKRYPIFTKNSKV